MSANPHIHQASPDAVGRQDAVVMPLPMPRMSALPVVNIAAYKFVPIADPAALAAAIETQAHARQLRGTVLVAGEGVNLFLAGAQLGIDGFLEWLRSDPRLAAIEVKHSRSQHVPFARLKVKVKREIIAFRRDQATPLQGRAATVTPATLARWLADGQDDAGRRVVLLDTRNREEIEYGTFAGAMTLAIDNFTDLPAALEAQRGALDDATVVSFCTGGIRCEKAALWMRTEGFERVLQLDGGILGYFEQVGGQGFDGRCFVFDERIALDPDLQPLVDKQHVNRPAGTADKQRSDATCTQALTPQTSCMESTLTRGEPR